MKKFAIAILTSAFIAAPAIAADTGFYAGVKLGSANKSINSISESNSAFGFFGGYSFNPNVAAEIGYTDLGTVASGIVKFSALELSAVGSYPINQQFSLYGKLGLANSKEEGGGFSGTRSALTYGVGGQFNAASNIGVRLGWEHYGTGGGPWIDGDASVVYAAGVFRF